MYDAILLPTDGSEQTVETMEHAIELAGNHDAAVHALAAVDERKYHSLPDERRTEARETMERRAERAVDEVAMRAEDFGLNHDTAVRDGIPSEAILTYAERQDIDVIVIGTRGQSDHERQVRLGSVTQRVVERANIPVFVVHIDPETELN